MNTQKNKHNYVDYKIEEAYFELLTLKQNNAITITDIVKKAEVSRASFYRNFHDKEDILKNYLKCLIYEIQEIVICKKTSKEKCEDILFVVRDERERIAVLLKQGYGTEILYLVNDLSLKFVDTYSIKQSMNQVYARVGLMFNVIVEWVLNGCRSDISDVVDAIMWAFYTEE